jgi:hypothetical protein
VNNIANAAEAVPHKPNLECRCDALNFHAESVDACAVAEPAAIPQQPR